MTKKALILTVGGSPEPLIYSIKREDFRPDLIYFIPSEDTKEIVDKIISEIPYEFEYKCAEVEDEESLEKSFKKASEVIKGLLKEDYEIRADFTGGTKVMTAGLVLASTSIDKDIEQVYVGSKPGEESRDKEGVGRVITGFEKFKPQDNPYETYAFQEFVRGKNFFNTYQYESAIKNFEGAESKLKDESLVELSIFYTKLVNFYQSWDKFNRKIETDEGKIKLEYYLNKEIINKCPKEFYNDIKNPEDFIKQLENNLEFLKLKFNKNIGEGIKYYLPDLLNNSYRKIEEGYYDDAVARLYRSIELIGQLELNKLGIIDQEKLQSNNVFYINRKQFMIETIDHENIRYELEKWNNKGYNEKDKTFKLALSKTYHLLKLFDNEIGRKYFADKELENAVKSKRNNSILAHGLKPLDKDSAIDFYNRVFSYAKKAYPDIEKYMELARFPKFEI